MASNMTNFDGLRVAAFESRRRDETEQLIRKLGGEPFVSPSMREVPLIENPDAVDFANRILAGEMDIVLFMTGVGVRYLLEQIERHVERERFLHALQDIRTVARGPKPVAALRELGIAPTFTVPPPNTWREVLGVIDAHLPVANEMVGLQEYGRTNPSLIAGLEARGARVFNLRVYQWGLPDDCGPLEQNVQAVAAGERDVLMFTSAPQVDHVLRVARNAGVAERLLDQARSMAVASIGPSTSERLREREFSVDIEPDVFKLGQLVVAAARDAKEVLERKRRAVSVLERPLPAGDQPDDTEKAWYDSPFMRACRRETVERVPIWLMRQAGRYMPEYRAIREKTTFLELCKNPGLCAEIMITAVDILGVDAAIIFSDLLPILEPMGLDLEFEAGEGPVIHNPVREASDVDRVLEIDNMSSLDFVMETVRETRAGLPKAIPVIGFAGAPFTLASYMIDGRSSRNHLHTKTLMYRDRGAWHELLQRLARSINRYLQAQIAAGAQAVQIFDSWVGCLNPTDYRELVLPYTQLALADLPPHVPVIHFGTGNPALLPAMSEAGGSVVGVDWRISLGDAWDLVGPHKAIQGNLDPTVLLADQDLIEQRAADILREAAHRPGHIFNLGHGVLPQTPVDNVRRLVDFVHEHGQHS